MMLVLTTILNFFWGNLLYLKRQGEHEKIAVMWDRICWIGSRGCLAEFGMHVSCMDVDQEKKLRESEKGRYTNI